MKAPIGPQGNLDCLYSKKNFFQSLNIGVLACFWGGPIQNLSFPVTYNLHELLNYYKLSCSLIEPAPDFIVRQVSGGICSTLLKSHRGSNTMNYSSKAVQEPFLSKIFRRLELKISQNLLVFFLYDSIFVCSTSLPLTSTRWVRLTLSSLCPLF